MSSFREIISFLLRSFYFTLKHVPPIKVGWMDAEYYHTRFSFPQYYLIQDACFLFTLYRSFNSIATMHEEAKFDIHFHGLVSVLFFLFNKKCTKRLFRYLESFAAVLIQFSPSGLLGQLGRVWPSCLHSPHFLLAVGRGLLLDL